MRRDENVIYKRGRPASGILRTSLLLHYCIRVLHSQLGIHTADKTATEAKLAAYSLVYNLYVGERIVSGGETKQAADCGAARCHPRPLASGSVSAPRLPCNLLLYPITSEDKVDTALGLLRNHTIFCATHHDSCCFHTHCSIHYLKLKFSVNRRSI